VARVQVRKLRVTGRKRHEPKRFSAEEQGCQQRVARRGACAGAQAPGHRPQTARAETLFGRWMPLSAAEVLAGGPLTAFFDPLCERGAGQARLSHKQVEQHRRLKAKQYLDQLRCLVPTGRDPKNDSNKVLSLAIEHLRSLLAGKDVTAKGTSMEPTGDLIFSMDADEVQQAKCEEATVQAKTDDSSKAGEALSEADKRLSHNEVEQKRRQEARHRYDELRALLPNASKFDKNTVLQHTIQAIQELAGVSDQALSKMMSELPVCDADNEGDSMVDSSASNAISAAASGLAQLASAGHKSPLSESPTDVLTFAASIAWLPACEKKGKTNATAKAEPSEEGVIQQMRESVGSDGAVQKQGGEERKRKVGEEGERAKGDAGRLAAAEDADRKKSRTVWPEATAAVVKQEEGAATEQQAREAREREAQRAFEDEMDGLDALSLLSHCAVQLQASLPNTPVLTGREGSWGETSIMSALPPMSLQAQAPPSAGKGSLALLAAAGAAARR